MPSRFSKPHSKEAGRSPRQLRVGEELRHALAKSLQLGDYPWPKELRRPIISVTEVQVSPDLRNATIFVMPLGGEQIKEVVKALNEHVHFFKNVIAQDVELRWIPQLRFTADTSFDYAAKIEKILHDPQVAKDLKETEED